MAGIKGKSGLKKGRTNNPNGRPKGSKNKIPNPVKKVMEEFAIDNFEQFKEDFLAVKDPYCRANLYLKVAIRLTPNAVHEGEIESFIQSQSSLINKLFRKDEDNFHRVEQVG